MKMAESAEVRLHLYRDLSNRILGEPDDGPMARDAHVRRRVFLEHLETEPGITVVSMGVAADKEPHELAEIMLAIAQNPTVQVALSGAALYVGKVLAGSIDRALGNVVERLFDKLVSAFRSKETGDFSIFLPDGSHIVVQADSTVHIMLNNFGHLESFRLDSPPDGPLRQPKEG
jgi:hypothetical protein